MSKKYNDEVRIIKIAGIIALTFIIFALCIITKIPSAKGYEISIYNEYPWYFWYFLIAAITCGIGIMVYQAFSTRKSRWWATGFYIVILSNLIIILMPIFRGYFISDMSDDVSHLGWIKNIALTGHFCMNDVYPISHILSYQILSICELDSRMVTKILPSVFYLVYMVGMYLLSKEICIKDGQSLLIMAFSSVLLFTYYHYLFLPTQFFLDLVPFVLFLFFRKINSINLSYAMIFIIFLLMMPLLHPLGSIFLIGIFLLLALVNPLCHFHAKLNNLEGKAYIYSLSSIIKPGSILFIVFFLWFMNFSLFRASFSQAYGWFVNGYGTPAIAALKDNLDASSFSILEVIDLLIKIYGHNFIYAFFSLVAIYVIYKKAFSQQSYLAAEEIFLALIFLAFSFFYILTLAGNFLVTGSSQRIFCWALMASTLINGIVSYEWLSKHLERNTILLYGILIIIIIIAVIIGIFSVYPSPHIMGANMEVTMMDWVGMEWFFDNKNSDDTMYFNQLLYRAPSFIYGFGMPKPKTIGEFYKVPLHIGYNEHYSLANSVNSDSYIVINECTRVSKAQLWPDKGRYTLNDLNLISSDSGICKIYSDRGLDIYHVLAFEK